MSRIKWDIMLEASSGGDAVDESVEAMDTEVGEVGDKDGEDFPTGEGAGSGEFISKDNRCDLLWRGVLPKRSFQGFKFQECKSAATARKLLEAKSVAHYWDMAYRADDMLQAAQI
jgi:U4/U6 small nuclear ribonucleoprotein PRP3